MTTVVMPTVSAMRYGWDGVNPWAVFEFIVGLLMGAWSPMIYNSHGKDCFTSHWSMAFGIVGYASYFDSKWEHSVMGWGVLVLNVAFNGYNTYAGMKNCLNQLEYSTVEKWEERFRNKGEVAVPEKKAINVADPSKTSDLTELKSELSQHGLVKPRRFQAQIPGRVDIISS